MPLPGAAPGTRASLGPLWDPPAPEVSLADHFQLGWNISVLHTSSEQSVWAVGALREGTTALVEPGAHKEVGPGVRNGE